MTTLAVVCALVISAGEGAERLPAFPGAEGFGAYAVGGRGGEVHIVDTLADYHPGHGGREAITRIETGEVIRPAAPAIEPETPIPGSLRAALNAKGPRTIVFAVAGTIALKAPLVISEPYVTIAGETAPGGGICLKNFGLGMRGTHDVIVRFLRVRPGDEQRLSLDAMNVATCENVIIDHCSTSWAIDEVLSVSAAGSNNVSVQWCFVTESLHDSYHPKGPHGMGSLIRTNGRVSFHHNLFAHHNARSPRPGTYGEGAITFDFRNNVVYNWRAVPGYSAEDPVRMDYVGNYLKPGPDSKKRGHGFFIGGEATRIYAHDNLLVDGDTRVEGGWALIARGTEAQRVEAPFASGYVATQSPEEAMEDVIRSAGASLPMRDAVDKRIVGEFESTGGRIIHSQQDAGAWPELAQGQAPPDADRDGVPDAWEEQHGLAPNNPEDRNADADGDGYTNLEEYLHHCAVVSR